MGKPAITNDYRKLADEIIHVSPLDFNADYFKSQYASLHSVQADRDDSIRLLSHELLSGDLFTGRDAKLIADRLHAIFGKAKIIITIREQVSIVESLYKYYVRGGGPLCIQDFVYKLNSPAVDVFGKSSIFTKFKYDKIIEYYQSLFGEENVAVIPFEILKQNPRHFEETFFKECGLDLNLENEDISIKPSNKGFSNLSISINRCLNNVLSSHLSNGILLKDISYYSYLRIFPRVFKEIDKYLARFSSKGKFTSKKKNKLYLRTLKPIIPATICDKLELDNSNSIAEEIMAVYRESNSRTAELTKIDLSKLGYPTL
jgi:hypothetical protein